MRGTLAGILPVCQVVNKRKFTYHSAWYLESALWWFVVDSSKRGKILWDVRKHFLTAVKFKHKLTTETGCEGDLTGLSKDKYVFV